MTSNIKSSSYFYSIFSKDNNNLQKHLFFCSCRGSVAVLLVILGIMSAITTVVNIVVILVFSRRKSLSNCQSTYKLSLAAADLLVGIFVLPTCVYTQYSIVGTLLTTDVKRTVTGYQLINESYVEVEA